jgi:hypothetical protein
MANVPWTRVVFASSLLLLMPYIILRIHGIIICVFGHYYPEILDFLQLIVTVTADFVYAYKGLRSLIRPDEKLLQKCNKYFAISFVISTLSLLVTTCFDDEEMIAITYETVNMFTISFSGVSLFLYNMKLSDDKEEENNNEQL